MLAKLFNKTPDILIDSMESMEKAVNHYGVLPFFHNPVKGLSVAELAEPGLLFGGADGFDGCWEWKGPVIQQQTSAYGKFFKKKAGFVSRELLPDFLNYRRYKYPVKEGSTEELLLDIIMGNEGMTSTELRKIINGINKQNEFPETTSSSFTHNTSSKNKKSSLEGPLQRLQMGGWLLIANFEYKFTRQGERYGWGVALYSTPEIWFGRLPKTDRSPEKSLEFLIKEIDSKLPLGNKKKIRQLLE